MLDGGIGWGTRWRGSLNAGGLVGGLLVSFTALAALEGPGITQFIPAARTTEPIVMDGRLDEPAWKDAPVFDSFVQTFPVEGAVPSERTEMRVLYDDHTLYIGFFCHDAQPALINRQLGRRDHPPSSSDSVQIMIDSAHDHRTAYVFQVTAGGVQLDGLQFQDTSFTEDWDAVWEGVSEVQADGWSAELAIPLHLLRFPAAQEQVWGFLAQRHISRTHEDVYSVLVPLNAGGMVSRAGHLSGLTALKPERTLELSPYLVSRSVLQPQFSDLTRPIPRMWNPSFDLGMDLKAALTSDLSLTATINPDFGQVEADEVILNLTNFEPFFPEKRPFFTQGLDVFQSVGTESGGVAPHMLFYSRRIGLTAPIFTATKLTGSVSRSVEIGVLDAFVMGAGAEQVDEENPDRRLRLNIERPLHLGVNSELPATRPVPTNFLVAVARGRLSPSATVGGRVVSAMPIAGVCTEEDMQLDSSLRPLGCSGQGGSAAALEWDLRTPDAKWGLLGQLSGSKVLGGPPERVLRDGIVLHRGESGMGALLQASKSGGEPFRFNIQYRYSSPTFDLNTTGFLRTQNEHHLGWTARYVRPSGLGLFRRFEARIHADGQMTADGRKITRGRAANVAMDLLLPGFQSVGFEAGVIDGAFDVREIPQTGIPFQRTVQTYALVSGGTDANQPLALDGYAALNRNQQVSGGDLTGFSFNANLTFRPQERLETKLSATLERTPYGPRFVSPGEDPDGYVFADLESNVLSMTLRQQLVITSRMTLQAYAQLFSSYGAFGTYYTAHANGQEAIRLTDLAASASGGSPGFRSAALNLSMVLRWEYRPGSTVFFVYSRSQSEPVLVSDTELQKTLRPVNLFDGRATDAVLIKWSYWLGL